MKRTGQEFTRTPKFKPRRDRRINAKVVECPSCGAGVGDPCFKLDGTESLGPLTHSARRRLAVRADNLTRGI